MKKWQKNTIFVIIVIIVFAAVYCGYQRLRFHRSGLAGVAELVQRMICSDSTEEAEATRLQEQLQSGEELTVDIDAFSTTTSLSTETANGRTVWYLNADGNEKVKILYIHGGSYTYEISTYQWTMLNKIAERTDAEIIIPDYRLAPFATYKEGYDFIEEIYTDVLKKYPDDEIYILADSAGGGLALGLTQNFVEKGIENPDGLILVSPWVDATLSNPEVEKYEAIDPSLCRDSLIADGKAWAGSLDPSDPKISPINGNMEGLPRVLLFTGTRELFYPDELALNDKLTAAGVDTTFIVGEGMNHVYPALPIPEGDEAINEIVSFIL